MPTPDTAPQEPRRGSLLVIFLTVFIDLLGFAMVVPLLPIYAENFGLEENGLAIGMLMSSFSIMQFLFAPVWGRLSDRFGRRPILLIGLAGSTLFYFLFGVATAWRSLAGLFITRIGQGIAGATIPTAQAYIADTTSLDSRARGMALIGAAFGFGFTFGPLIGAAAFLATTDVGESPWPGYAAAALSGGSLLLAVVLLPESLRADRQSKQHSWLNADALRDALKTPSIPALLITSFISLLSFGGFETTLAVLLKDEDGHFRFAFHQVLLFFAFIGLTLTIAQGGIVRQLAKRIPERTLAAAGALVSIAGFGLLAWASQQGGLTLLMIASAVEVTGFSLITPPLLSLISRRSDPAKQGGILGISQSVSALARIAGPLVALPLYFQSAPLPYYASMGLMVVALIMLLVAARGGTDFVERTTEQTL